jgi:hypothetical protein
MWSSPAQVIPDSAQDSAHDTVARDIKDHSVQHQGCEIELEAQRNQPYRQMPNDKLKAHMMVARASNPDMGESQWQVCERQRQVRPKQVLHPFNMPRLHVPQGLNGCNGHASTLYKLQQHE